MEIKEYSKIVDDWIKDIGVRYFDELTNTTLLMEEVGEVARIIARDYGEQSWKKGAEKSELADELADVFFVLTCIANQTGVIWNVRFEITLRRRPREMRIGIEKIRSLVHK